MFKTLLTAAGILLLGTGISWSSPETLTGTRAASDFPVYQPIGAGNLAVATGVYEIAAAVETGDIFELLKLPAGACVVDGFVRADDIDTGGSEALDMDVGWKANGDVSLDADGFGNLGLWSGDAVTDVRPEVQIYFPFGNVLKDGPKCFTKETTIQITAVTASNGGHTGTVYVAVYYYVP